MNNVKSLKLLSKKNFTFLETFAEMIKAYVIIEMSK